jgi:hypothetical protein
MKVSKRLHPTDPNLYLCYTCGEYKYHYKFSNDLKAKDGLKTRCKKCVNNYANEQYQINKKHIKEIRKNIQTENKEIISYSKQHPIYLNLFHCLSCGNYKAIEEFNVCNSRKNGIDVHCRECSVKKLEKLRRAKGMKPAETHSRKHPEKYNFFWCPQCKQYKKKSAFGFKKNRYNQIDGSCKECKRKREKQPDYKEKVKTRMKEHKEKLTDTYIKRRLSSDIDKNATVIELKRQEIIMKQTLDKFNNWRKENGLSEPEPLKKPRSKLHPEYKNLAWCPSCEEYKPLEYFFKDSSSTYGITVYCKICHAERKRLKIKRRKQDESNYANV